MKKIMWIISILSLVFTTVVLLFMPDSVPMHYDITGEIDRWGSKYENLLFPAIILLMSLLWHLFISYYEKKSNKASVEKERAEALSNAKVMKIVGVSMASMFTVMQGFILYSSYVEANSNATHAYIDIGKVSCILVGIIFIVLGNFMPKTKMNRVAGVRVSWSMYNDTTWMKSNRLGAVAMIIVGVLTIITTVFTKSSIAVIMLIIYLLVATVITLIYSYKVYKKELDKSNNL